MSTLRRLQERLGQLEEEDELLSIRSQLARSYSIAQSENQANEACSKQLLDRIDVHVVQEGKLLGENLHTLDKEHILNHTQLVHSCVPKPQKQEFLSHLDEVQGTEFRFKRSVRNSKSQGHTAQFLSLQEHSQEEQIGQEGTDDEVLRQQRAQFQLNHRRSEINEAASTLFAPDWCSHSKRTPPTFIVNSSSQFVEVVKGHSANHENVKDTLSRPAAIHQLSKWADERTGTVGTATSKSAAKGELERLQDKLESLKRPRTVPAAIRTRKRSSAVPASAHEVSRPPTASTDLSSQLVPMESLCLEDLYDPTEFIGVAQKCDLFVSQKQRAPVLSRGGGLRPSTATKSSKQNVSLDTQGEMRRPMSAQAMRQKLLRLQNPAVSTRSLFPMSTLGCALPNKGVHSKAWDVKVDEIVDRSDRVQTSLHETRKHARQGPVSAFAEAHGFEQMSEAYAVLNATKVKKRRHEMALAMTTIDGELKRNELRPPSEAKQRTPQDIELVDAIFNPHARCNPENRFIFDLVESTEEKLVETLATAETSIDAYHAQRKNLFLRKRCALLIQRWVRKVVLVKRSANKKKIQRSMFQQYVKEHEAASSIQSTVRSWLLARGVAGRK